MEGKWETFLPARRTATDLLRVLQDAGAIRVELNDTLRRRHLRSAFESWGRKRAYPIGYLAAHGDRGSVSVRSIRGSASLVDIAAWIGAGRADGRVLVLGTCLTLGAPTQAQQLVNETGLTAAFGYRRSVDTVHAAAWELLLLDTLAEVYAGAAGRQPTIDKLQTRMRRLEERHHGLAQELGFRSVWRH
jgi:hypothetical protein